MRAVGWIVGNTMLAGAIVTWIAGAAAAVLFRSWAEEHLGRAAARAGLALLLCSPFGYFLAGAVYSDALFLAATLGAFVLVERDSPMLAGLAGAVATATRPVGVAVVVGLAAVTIARRRPSPPRLRDAGVLLSAAGLLAFCALLWWRFGEPLAFSKVQTAAGWGRRVDWDTVLSADYFRRFHDHSPNLIHLGLTVQAVLSVAAVALIPATFRRLGWGYGLYTALVVGIPLLTSSDFIAMGRYVLAAFPLFAVAGALLAETSRRLLPSAAIAGSAALSVLRTSLFAQWYLL
jgi:hypothetical protein